MIEGRLDAHLTLCRYCDAQVVWADDFKAKTRFPLDANMSACPEVGTIALNQGADGKLKAMTPTAGQAAGMRSAGVVLYAMHALTCMRADEWHVAREHGKATRRARTGRR